MDNKGTGLNEWSVGTSSALFGALTEEHIEACQTAGIDCIELVVSRSDPEHGKGYIPLIPKLAERGIDVWSVHLPFGHAWDISSLDQATRDRAIAWNEQIMKQAVEWGVNKAILHPSYEPIDAAERSERMKYCGDSLNKLGEIASTVGIQIAIECLPRTCLGNMSEEIMTLLEAHPSLGVCCDVNHLLQETPEQFIAEVGEHIVTLHISDYDGLDEKHWIPGRGVIDWNAVLGALTEANYAGPFMFEVSRKGGGDEPVTPEALVQCWHDLKANYRKG